jgi:hypothetical protein
MMHQAAPMNWPSFMQRLLEGIEHEARIGGTAHAPPDNATGIGIDYEGYINEA